MKRTRGNRLNPLLIQGREQYSSSGIPQSLFKALQRRTFSVLCLHDTLSCEFGFCTYVFWKTAAGKQRIALYLYSLSRDGQGYCPLGDT